MSAIAVSSGYLRGWPLPYLSCGSCGGGFIGSCTVLSVLNSVGFRLISGLDFYNFNYKYGLITVDWKDINLLSNLTVYFSPLTVNRLYSLS